MGNCSKHGQFSTICRACDYDVIKKETEMTTETETKSDQSQPMPHRWAEVIKAWADGKEIQWRYVEPGNNWVTYSSADRPSTMLFSADQSCEWRIKPETKTGWIIIYNDNTLSKLIHETEERCRYMSICANGGIAANIAAIIPITYTEGEGL